MGIDVGRPVEVHPAQELRSGVGRSPPDIGDDDVGFRHRSGIDDVPQHTRLVVQRHLDVSVLPDRLAPAAPGLDAEGQNPAITGDACPADIDLRRNRRIARIVHLQLEGRQQRHDIERRRCRQFAGGRRREGARTHGRARERHRIRRRRAARGRVGAQCHAGRGVGRNVEGHPQQAVAVAEGQIGGFLGDPEARDAARLRQRNGRIVGTLDQVCGRLHLDRDRHRAVGRNHDDLALRQREHHAGIVNHGVDAQGQRHRRTAQIVDAHRLLHGRVEVHLAREGQRDDAGIIGVVGDHLG